MPELRLYRFPRWQETPYKFVYLKRHTNIAPKDKAPPTESTGRMDESLSRSRRLVFEYIMCNPFDLFCTFTFDKSKVHDRKDYKAIKAKLCKAFNNYRVRYDADFRYLIVPELHKDGAVHFHGVITAPYGLCCPLLIPKVGLDGKKRKVKNTPRYMDWPYYSEKFGFFSCSWIRNYTGCALYVSEYMTSDLTQWFEKNDQIVMHSKGLKRPELVNIYYDQTIPGGVDKARGDYSDEFCAVAMRTASETSELYFDADDAWEHYQQEVERWAVRRYTDKGVLTPITDPAGQIFPGAFREYPGQFDNWEQVSMNAVKIMDAIKG